MFLSSGTETSINKQVLDFRSWMTTSGLLVEILLSVIIESHKMVFSFIFTTLRGVCSYRYVACYGFLGLAQTLQLPSIFYRYIKINIVTTLFIQHFVFVAIVHLWILNNGPRNFQRELIVFPNCPHLLTLQPSHRVRWQFNAWGGFKFTQITCNSSEWLTHKLTNILFGPLSLF